MKIKFVRLQNFRNAGFAEVALGADSVWIHGNNAQGKTNLLESLSMLAALRSFRTPNMGALIKHGEKSAAILAGIEHENYGECEVRMDISDKRTAFIGGNEIKFSDFIGKFPALAMSSEDLRILRGAPEIRRKDTDMFISQVDAEYLAALRRYYAGLAHRNALLRQNCGDESFYAPFESEMASAAHVIYQKRDEWLGKIGKLATQKYEILARENGESSQMRLKCSCQIESAEDFSKLMRDDRPADIERRTTRHGPHRDDFSVNVGGKDAKLYASEGQQRSAVLALKLAQFELIKLSLGIEPVILCDDILGELDPHRRTAFWECIDTTAQVIATSTTPAPSDALRSNWKTVEVSNGNFLQ